MAVVSFSGFALRLQRAQQQGDQDQHGRNCVASYFWPRPDHAAGYRKRSDAHFPRRRSRPSAETMPIPMFTRQSSGRLLAGFLWLFCICSHAAVDTRAQVEMLARDRPRSATERDGLRMAALEHRAHRSPSDRKCATVARPRPWRTACSGPVACRRWTVFPFGAEAWSRGAIERRVPAGPGKHARAGGRVGEHSELAAM